jgi:hypothetical protein
MIFINHRHLNQIDILFNTPDDYLVIININTRYAILESIPDILITSILSAFKAIFKKLKLKSWESDEKATFFSKSELKYLKKKDIEYDVITEQRHNNLSVINRFIRTIHDWMRK